MLKKSLELLRQEAAESGTNTLKRTLNGFNLITIGIGVIIGAGLFSLTGLAITAIVVRDTAGSAWFNALVVTLKVSVVLVFIALGWQYIDPANYQPYIPANTGEFGEFGWSGILRGAGVIYLRVHRLRHRGHHGPRKPRIRSAICPSAFSARC